MTGLWQVSGKSELPFEDRLKLEEYYVRSRSLWLDFNLSLRIGRLSSDFLGFDLGLRTLDFGLFFIPVKVVWRG